MAAAGVKAQLKTLWLRQVKELYIEEEQDEAVAEAGLGGPSG